MSDPQQQKKVLALLLLVLGGAIGYRLLEDVGGARGAAGRRVQAAAVDRELAAIDMPRLELKALQLKPRSFKPGRDPFRYGVAPPPPPPPKKARPPRKRRPPRPKPVATPPVPARPAAPPKPKPPAIDFNYLGSFGPEERRIAVFVKEDEIINAVAGDVVLGRFIVDKIGFESADIKYVGFPDTPQTRLEAGG